MPAFRTEIQCGTALFPISRGPIPLPVSSLLAQFRATGQPGELRVVNEQTGLIVLRQSFGCEPEEGDAWQPLPMAAGC